MTKQDQDETRKTDNADPQIDKMDPGGHLGGTHLGGVGGDAKVKDTREGGDKARPNDGTN